MFHVKNWTIENVERKKHIVRKCSADDRWTKTGRTECVAPNIFATNGNFAQTNFQNRFASPQTLPHSTLCLLCVCMSAECVLSWATRAVQQTHQLNLFLSSIVRCCCHFANKKKKVHRDLKRLITFFANRQWARERASTERSRTRSRITA